MATGPQSDVRWTQTWRTVGQELMYVGLDSDERAKMQHWGVIIWYNQLNPLVWSLYLKYLQSVLGIDTHTYTQFFTSTKCIYQPGHTWFSRHWDPYLRGLFNYTDRKCGDGKWHPVSCKLLQLSISITHTKHLDIAHATSESILPLVSDVE